MSFASAYIKQAVQEASTICPAPCKLTFDLLTLKVVTESLVMWPTSVPILGPLYTTDRRQTDVRRASSLIMPLP